MNEEQAVLDFFSQEENLPLALIAGDHIDGIRQQRNNAFWRDLQQHLAAYLAREYLPWDCQLTEDRNSEDCLVGVHLQPQAAQSLFLRPFMEQQFMGEGYRIYYGLIWNTTPEPDRLRLPEIAALRTALQGDGLKESDSFLAWGWTPWHPRRRDFLLRFTQDHDALLDDAVGLITHLLNSHNKALATANAALVDAPRSIAVPLEQLRASLKK
ncbi:MAG: hypothetical protein LBE50_02470 [Gallionellaceae bacterium]|jgi:hypothetical protein|nr:hypothetical protein [Gallionellaceae bacterium]